jgi:uncharacterized protein YdiU (UPF0061 family)
METLASATTDMGWRLEHSYATLPQPLFSRVKPTPVQKPQAVLFNQRLAQVLGLSATKDTMEELASMLGGNTLPPGAEPIAQAYMGHQFGYPNMLGDGRAILLGEQLIPNGLRFDIQLKGSGITRYSRRGDGRATLYSMLREYIISEAMHHLGIPTTRSLAVVATGEPVYREAEHEGAVLTRVAASHIRVGTFEYASAHLPKAEFEAFLQYVIARHYPQLTESSDPVIDLLKALMERQADLIAEWMRVGFIHGVMNTDNMSVAGETIDYGPCAFMNNYHPGTVFSSIDTGGRYAFGNQPAIAHWNLAVFATTLLPLLNDDNEKAIDQAREVIYRFESLFAEKWTATLRRKLGMLNELPIDKALADELLQWMQQNQADYTNTFVDLTSNTFTQNPAYQDDAFKHWHARWQQRLLHNEQPEGEAYRIMRAANPVFIPRNHLVEEALEAATLGKDMSLVYKLLQVLETPYSLNANYEAYRQPPAAGDVGYRTFCGT